MVKASFVTEVPFVFFTEGAPPLAGAAGAFAALGSGYFAASSWLFLTYAV